MAFRRRQEVAIRLGVVAAACAVLVAGLLPGLPTGPVGQASAPEWLQTGSPPATVLALGAIGPGEVLAGTTKGLYKSTDGGRTWALQDAGLGERTVRSIVFDESNPSTVYLGTRGGVYRSRDRGLTWRQIGLGQYDVYAVALNDRAPGTIFAGAAGAGSVFKSEDDGESWTPCSIEGPESAAAQALVFDPETFSLYAATRTLKDWGHQNRLRFSNDGGASWLPRSRGLPDVDVRSLALDSGGSTLYVGTNGEGVYRSADGGRRWVAANSGLPEGAYVWSLASHPVVGGTLLAGTDQGIYKSENGGGYWVPFQDGMGATTILAVAVEGNGSVYAATWHQGIWRYDGQVVPLPTPTPAPTPTPKPGPSATATPVPSPTPAPALPTDPVEQFPSSDDVWYFPETGHSLGHGFLRFWLTQGGIEQFGYPLTEEFEEDGTIVQYFERALLEYHPASGDQPERIVIGHLGRKATEGRYFINVWYFPTTEDQAYFPETGHSLSHGFLRYWRNNGGLERFGYPISEEMDENGRSVQYFERARLEYNPDRQGTDQEISVGLLGREVLEKRGWLASEKPAS